MTQHIHLITLVLPSCEVFCGGCSMDFRLATRDEAIFIQETDGYMPDGPLLLNDNGVIVVPLNYSLYQEV